MTPSSSLRATFGVLALLAFGAALAPGAAAQDTPPDDDPRADVPSFLFNPAYWSTRANSKKAIHDGNDIAITFHNFGLLAGIGEVRGNWPKGSNDFYVGDVIPTIAMEVPVDSDGDGVVDSLYKHAATVRGPGLKGNDGPRGGGGEFWGFEATRGFAAGGDNERPALSTAPETWPDFWPDEPNWIDPATGDAQWNGFFGRGVLNADLESYFWLDDQNDRELQSGDLGFTFFPDSTDLSRNGTGIAVKVRGLQWSQFLAQDALFFLYEVVNTSTTTYPRVSVGLNVGTLAGGDGDSSDDLAFFDQANQIVYSYDFDNSGNERQDVGYVGYGFLESPGNPRNGIDDDGDGDPSTDQGRNVDGSPKVSPALTGSDNTFALRDFEPRVLAAGDPIVLIDPVTYERSVVYLEAGGMTVQSLGQSYTIAPGQTLEETQIEIDGNLPFETFDDVIATEKNLIDEDLDGLIDEDRNLHFERRAQNLQGQVITLPAVKFKNYVGFYRAAAAGGGARADSIAFGLLNPMIDERRDDGIDNDGDWNPSTNDTGADGLAGTGDEGENDGVPSPGEAGFDALDIDESDQVGLSSFFYFTPPGALQMDRDQEVWDAMQPGFFTTNEELADQQDDGGVDGDFIFSSGYFRMEPGEVLRFSLALVFGNDLEDITNNTLTVQEIYNRNYNFARPPDAPRLSAVPGDGRVTLYWDTRAEDSFDPLLGEDFEGYKLYKSTDPFFQDPDQITDAFGNRAILDPLVQYDRADGIAGIWPDIPPPDYAGAQTAKDSIAILEDYLADAQQSENLQERTRGTPFYLGDDTGLRHSYVDTLVDNGRRYYYALTAYDRGSAAFFPAENNFAISVAADGEVTTGINVVEVTPEAPAGGYVAGIAGENGMATPATTNPADGQVFVEVLDPMLLEQDRSYAVEFFGGQLVSDSFRVVSQGATIVESAIKDANSNVFDGIRLAFNNQTLRIDRDASGFVDSTGMAEIFYDVARSQAARLEGRLVPYTYEIRFGTPSQSLGDFRLGSRGPTPPSVATDFQVYNVTLDRPSDFAFTDNTPNGSLDLGDTIFIVEPIGQTRQATFALRYDAGADGNLTGDAATSGDVFRIVTDKPFSVRDRFTFRTTRSATDLVAATASLEDVRVVPNPYLVAASWERPLAPTQTSGRGERRMDFINLPPGARIRIYNVRGELVRELRHDGAINNGAVSWDLRTREDLEVAYGVYFYHVEAPGVGETTGRLAIIK